MVRSTAFGDILNHGFLPSSDPLLKLPRPFEPWENLAQQLPKILVASKVRSAIRQLPLIDPAPLQNSLELERAMLILSYLGHSYVWGESKPADALPANLAVPWHHVAKKLGRPPVLSYASYALHNWRKIDPHGPVALGNIVLLQNFLGGIDEEWFVLVHVDIEAKAIPAIAAIAPAQECLQSGRLQELASHLNLIAATLKSMNVTMDRMPEHCDPYIYFNRVRPYLYGWKNHPALPEGVIYRGVSEYEGVPRQFRGETGAQSAIVPCLDALLGISHADDPLKHYLQEMRDYMPPRHRSFLEAIESGPQCQEVVLKNKSRLADAYNSCLEGLAAFRRRHFEYAGRYIQQQSQQSGTNLNAVGTGGTPFMSYLRKHLEETENQKVS